MTKFTIISLAVMLCAMNLFAQTEVVKYRRSSLSMVLIESESFPNQDAVMKSWNNYPFPDKYNQHNIETKSSNIAEINLTDNDLMEAGYLHDTLSTLKLTDLAELTKAVTIETPIKYLDDEKSLALILPNKKQELQLKIDKFIRENELAKQLVSTWFGRNSEGKFNLELIKERGSYNASEMEANIANGEIKGNAALQDAGEELIKNTFTTFTKLNFVPNEPVARGIRDAAKETTLASLEGSPQMIIDKAMKGIDKVYDKTKEGYSLWSKTWLYRLDWNDSIADIFYTNLYNNPSEFDKTDMFKLILVGTQNNQSLVTFKLGEKRTEEQIIDLTEVRNLDNAFAELQRKNDVFKPKFPITSTDPIKAQLGLKEGIVPGDQFDILEMVWNEKEGKTEWKKVGNCSVDKKSPIWDNKYNAGEDIASQEDKKGNPITATTFKGGPKNVQVGMLLKLKK